MSISVLPVNPLCTQACTRTGTLQTQFCPNDFGKVWSNFHSFLDLKAFIALIVFFLFLVITGKVTSLTPAPRDSVTVEVSLIKSYKKGRLSVTKVGPSLTVTLTSACKRCPGLSKGTERLICWSLDTWRSFQQSSLIHKHMIFKELDLFYKYVPNIQTKHFDNVF